MTDMTGSTILITGASSGIGEACAEAFAPLGARLLLAGRRVERMQSLAERLVADHSVDVHVLPLDVRDVGVVSHVLGDLPAAWAEIDVLVNNAGLSLGLEPLAEGDHRDWDTMIDTNVKGLLYVSRAVLPGMVERGRGHVINLGSIAGSEIYPMGNVYCATKAAVSALSKGMRMDLVGSPVRVTNVQPGMVETEFSRVRFHGDESRADRVYEGVTPLSAHDVADAIVYAATRPAHVNIDEIVLKPVAQASSMLVARS